MRGEGSKNENEAMKQVSVLSVSVCVYVCTLVRKSYITIFSPQCICEMIFLNPETTTYVMFSSSFYLTSFFQLFLDSFCPFLFVLYSAATIYIVFTQKYIKLYTTSKYYKILTEILT